MAPFPYKQIFAVDPANKENVARNAQILIYAPGDVTKTPLTITDASSGLTLANPVTTNDNGFSSMFMHATLPQVAWEGGGFTGTFESFEGLRDEAVAAVTAAGTAQSAAETAAASAADAATNAAAGAAGALATAVTAAETAATNAANSAALVNAPADVAIAAAINGTGVTATALTATNAAQIKSTLDALRVDIPVAGFFDAGPFAGVQVYSEQGFGDGMVIGVDPTGSARLTVSPSSGSLHTNQYVNASPAQIAPAATVDGTQADRGCIVRYKNRYYGVFQDVNLPQWAIWSTSAGLPFSWRREQNLTMPTDGTWGNGNATSFGQCLDYNANYIFCAEYGDAKAAKDGAMNPKIRRSADGITWTTVYTGTFRHMHAVACDPYAEGHVYVTTGDGSEAARLLRSVDNGTTWTEVYAGTALMQSVQISFSPTHIWLAPDSDFVSVLCLTRTTPLATSNLTRGTTYTTGGTFEAVQHFWKITAIDSTRESLGSNEIQATMNATGSVDFTWTAVAGATGYKLYRRKTGEANYTLIAATLGAVTSYKDTGTNAGAGTIPTVANSPVGQPKFAAMNYHGHIPVPGGRPGDAFLSKTFWGAWDTVTQRYYFIAMTSNTYGNRFGLFFLDKIGGDVRLMTPLTGTPSQASLGGFRPQRIWFATESGKRVLYCGNMRTYLTDYFATAQ